MTGFEAYKKYLAFKLHFKQDSYDFFIYNQTTSATKPSTYENRRDRFSFEKISKICSEEKYIIKMLVEQKNNNSFWIKDLITRDNELKYLEWVGYHDSYEASLKKEFSNIREYCLLEEKKFTDLIKTSKDEQHCILLKMYLQNKISEDFMHSLNIAVGLFDIFDKEYKGDPIWEENKYLLKKYKPFISKYFLEKEKIRAIMIDCFKSL